ncbi:MAG: response regulator transcription factor [Myxococcales bacterium]|jgi:two-component system phosphate regulon response regulator PhoB
MVSALVIGGSETARELLEEHMRPEGFDPVFAASGREGLSLAARGGFGLAVVDLVLPDMPGTEVIRQLKQAPYARTLPVVVVTRLDTEIDRIVAFELGAVDYVTEPFSVRELLLRMRVAVSEKASAEEPRRPAPHGVLVLDFEARRALVRDEEVALSPREFELLSALHARGGGVCSREQLRETVWGDEGVSLRTVDASIKRLRKKLGAARFTVETVRGVGYRFRDGEDQRKCA